MSSRELFVVLLRALGVFEFVEGVVLIPQWTRALFLHSAAGQMTSGQIPVAELLWALGLPGLKIVAGGVLFVAANWFARKVYAAGADAAGR